MKASQVIRQLAQDIEMYGDREVMIRDDRIGQEVPILSIGHIRDKDDDFVILYPPGEDG